MASGACLNVSMIGYFVVALTHDPVRSMVLDPLRRSEGVVVRPLVSGSPPVSLLTMRCGCGCRRSRRSGEVPFAVQVEPVCLVVQVRAPLGTGRSIMERFETGGSPGTLPLAAI